MTNWIGTGAPRFFMPLDVTFPQANVSQLIILPKAGVDRKTVINAINEKLPLVAPEARIRAKVLPNGPRSPSQSRSGWCPTRSAPFFRPSRWWSR